MQNNSSQFLQDQEGDAGSLDDSKSYHSTTQGIFNKPNSEKNVELSKKNSTLLSPN